MVETQSTPISSETLAAAGLQAEAEQRRREELAYQQAVAQNQQQYYNEQYRQQQLQEQSSPVYGMPRVLTEEEKLKTQQKISNPDLTESQSQDILQKSKDFVQSFLNYKPPSLSKEEFQKQVDSGNRRFISGTTPEQARISPQQYAKEVIGSASDIGKGLYLGGKELVTGKTNITAEQAYQNPYLAGGKALSTVLGTYGIAKAASPVVKTFGRGTSSVAKLLSTPVSKIPVVGGVTEGLIGAGLRTYPAIKAVELSRNLNKDIRNYEVPKNLSNRNLQSYLTEVKENANQNVIQSQPGIISAVGAETLPFLQRYKQPFIRDAKKQLRELGFPEKDINLLADEIWRQQIGSYGAELYGALGAEALANVLGGRNIGRRITRLSNKGITPQKLSELGFVKRGLKLAPAYITPGAAEGAAGVLSSQIARGRPGQTKQDKIKEILYGSAFGAATATGFGFVREGFGGKGITKRAGKYVTEGVGYVTDPYEAPGDILTKYYYGSSKRRIPIKTFSSVPSFSQATTDIKNKIGGFSSTKTNANTPSNINTFIKSNVPSNVPSDVPSNVISEVPSQSNVISEVPSNVPSNVPTNVQNESNVINNVPSNVPSNVPAFTFTPKIPFGILPLGAGGGKGGGSKNLNKKVINNMIGGLFSKEKKKSPFKSRKKNNLLKGKI